jgi:hypothetical protein
VTVSKLLNGLKGIASLMIRKKNYPKELPKYPQKAMGRRFVVAKLFCRKLRRGANFRCLQVY